MGARQSGQALLRVGTAAALCLLLATGATMLAFARADIPRSQSDYVDAGGDSIVTPPVTSGDQMPSPSPSSPVPGWMQGPIVEASESVRAVDPSLAPGWMVAPILRPDQYGVPGQDWGVFDWPGDRPGGTKCDPETQECG